MTLDFIVTSEAAMREWPANSTQAHLAIEASGEYREGVGVSIAMPEGPERAEIEHAAEFLAGLGVMSIELTLPDRVVFVARSLEAARAHAARLAEVNES
jgi:hypothetical protein